ncbi:MAG TPA: CDF family Co(II)/Ni(II) efflux transporter DmeF [Candidatus Kapabacteria bacterium]|nr:CDF family Co(II)/Ni(II) efflux transporter DmeF [Candidatus Kapabacteria bacterium]
MAYSIVHQTDHASWKHSHDFSEDSSIAERRTRAVILITALMMVVEIAAGIAFKSMALLADGWHMSTHVAAFLITALAYYFSRRHRADPRYSFGTGKMGVLGGYTSAVVLFVVAALMAGESLHRVFVPAVIQFNQAIGIAAIGLLVNLVCAALLNEKHHHHGRGHGHDHSHEHAHHDHNLRAAYLHVLADALTSVTAIVALIVGKYLGWVWLDPVMGIVGSIVVAIWAIGLVRDTSGILLDRTPEWSDLPDEIRKVVESDGDSLLSDLHVWQVATNKFACIVSIVAHEPHTLEEYRERLREHEELVHVTVQLERCNDEESVKLPTSSSAV